jgi:hypothetical protein
VRLPAIPLLLGGAGTTAADADSLAGVASEREQAASALASMKTPASRTEGEAEKCSM